MSDRKRIPGAVDEKAGPLGKPVFSANARSAVNEPLRDPGPVEEPAEPVSDSAPEQTTDAEIPRVFIESSPWKIVFLLMVIAGAIWLLAEAAISLYAVYDYSVYLGIPLIVFAFVVLGTTGWAARREYRAVKSIDRLEQRDANIRAALEINDLKSFNRTLGPVLANIQKRQPGLVGDYRAATEDSESVEDSLNQFENIVLTRLDTEVDSLIKHSVMIGGAAVTVIPHPALDAIFILWRGQTLVRKIGIIYGLEATGLSSWRLLKHVIISAFVAATVEEFGGIALEQITHQAFAKALHPVAEGSVSALRLYRLGKLAQRACRPQPARA
jgi:uncharacterized membrane protein YcjF (UPF0283 family)